MPPTSALPQAASFTDDTSLPFVGYRVSIHAQIIRENQINWCFFLKDRTPHNNGEFKDQVVNTFFGLAETDREKVFKTLRTVRIHIVDPRPYTIDINDALEKHLPKGIRGTSGNFGGNFGNFGELRELRVAVGTTISDRPPHRSVRALLTHTAPTLDIWRRSARSGKDAQAGAGEASVGSVDRAGPG